MTIARVYSHSIVVSGGAGSFPSVNAQIGDALVMSGVTLGPGGSNALIWSPDIRTWTRNNTNNPNDFNGTTFIAPICGLFFWVARVDAVPPANWDFTVSGINDPVLTLQIYRDDQGYDFTFPAIGGGGSDTTVTTPPSPAGDEPVFYAQCHVDTLKFTGWILLQHLSRPSATDDLIALPSPSATLPLSWDLIENPQGNGVQLAVLQYSGYVNASDDPPYEALGSTWNNNAPWRGGVNMPIAPFSDTVPPATITGSADWVLPPLNWLAMQPGSLQATTQRFDAGLGSAYYVIPQLTDSGDELRSKTVKAVRVTSKRTNSAVRVYPFDVEQEIDIADMEDDVRTKGSTNSLPLTDSANVSQSARKQINVKNAVLSTVRVSGNDTGQETRDRIDEIVLEQSQQGVRR